MALACFLTGSGVGSGVFARGDSASPDSGATTFLLVRHAERDTLLLGSDPPLSAAGLRRALTLVHALGDAGISAIYVTEFLRNRQTAMPLAARLGDSLRVLRGRNFAEQAWRLKAEHAGQTVLIVGHSDTIPQLIEALSGCKVPAFGRNEWDALYVVTVFKDRPAKVLLLRYGEPSGGR